MVSTLIEADVGLFEVLNVRWVLERCLKSEVKLKVYFKQTVSMAILRPRPHVDPNMELLFSGYSFRPHVNWSFLETVSRL